MDDGCVRSAALVTICRMTRGVRAATVAGILLLTITACKSGDARGTKPLPPLSPSGTSSAASPTPTVMPSKPADPKAEVEAFVRAYFDAVNVGSRTGDTAPWRAMMTEDCICRDSATDIEKSFAGGSIRGLTWTVRDVVVQGVSRKDAQLLVTFDVSAHDDLDRNGAVRTHYPEYTNAKDAMTLIWLRGDWRVADVDLVRKGDVR